MDDPVGPGIASLGHSRAASEDVSMNGAHPVPSTNGEATESSTDSGFTGQGVVYLPKLNGGVKRRGLQPTGVYYDDRMKLHMNVDWTANDHHPEDPRRIEEIYNTFKEAGLIFTGNHADIPRILQDTPNKYMYPITSRKATKDEICLAHTGDHYDWVESVSKMSYQELRILTKIKDQGRDSLYVSTMSFLAALLSAGGAIEVAQRIVTGQLKNGFAIIRPPGHHAEHDHAMGFCFFNNVPIAARACQQQFPEQCRKVLILDWDVHHGNGVQNIFYDDPNVLYISLHVYGELGEFYPGPPPPGSGLADGGIKSCGTGPGLGRNVNIPWPKQGMGNAEYMRAFQKIVMPIAQEFDPDLVMISAGFDAADGDELGGCHVTPECYAHMTHMLMSLADGKVAVCLEGGYNLNAIAQSALAVAHTLMGEPPPRMAIPDISLEAKELLAEVQAYQAPYWECMRQGVIAATDLTSNAARRLDGVIRSEQVDAMMKKHKMVSIHIHEEAVFEEFEHQVLVTPGIQEARKLLIVIHDPPQVVGQAGVDNKLDSHNVFIEDGVPTYVDWAVENDFGVMDINVPLYKKDKGDNQESEPPFRTRKPEKDHEDRIRDLMCYLWDNYIQIFNNDAQIFLLGVGNAHYAVKALLTFRDSKSQVRGVVNFVTQSLKAVKSDIDPDLSSWYKTHSLVYVGQDHICWLDPELKRRVLKRRFGNVVQSPQTGLGKMMQHHANDVKEFIQSRLEHSGDSTEDEGMQ